MALTVLGKAVSNIYKNNIFQQRHCLVTIKHNISRWFSNSIKSIANNLKQVVSERIIHN